MGSSVFAVVSFVISRTSLVLGPFSKYVKRSVKTSAILDTRGLLLALTSPSRAKAIDTNDPNACGCNTFITSF